MSRRKAALPPEFEPKPRRNFKSQQRGASPAAALAAGSQQGQPLGQQGAAAASGPFQPQQDSDAAGLGSMLGQSSASVQQVRPCMGLTHVCLR